MKKFCFIISILVAIPLAMAFLRGYKDSQSLMSQPLYETMFFVMKGYGVCHWQQADSIEQIIDYLENDCMTDEDNPWKKEYQQLLCYLKDSQSRYVYFATEKGTAIFLSQEYGYAVSERVFDPCLFAEVYSDSVGDLSRQWRNAAMRKLMIDSEGHLLWDTEECLDTIFYQMSMELDEEFPFTDYYYEYHACTYDFLKKELLNHCTGEAFSAEISNIVIPYLEQIRAIYPQVVYMKFCRKLPVRR